MNTLKYRKLYDINWIVPFEQMCTVLHISLNRVMICIRYRADAVWMDSLFTKYARWFKSTLPQFARADMTL